MVIFEKVALFFKSFFGNVFWENFSSFEWASTSSRIPSHTLLAVLPILSTASDEEIKFQLDEEEEDFEVTGASKDGEKRCNCHR